MEAHDNRALLQQAMEALWGSAEAFYQEYFQHLSPAERAKFGEVIDRLI